MEWPQSRILELPNLHMAIYEAGTPRADRPSVILCHGFPEIAYSWRHILPKIAAAGFHVIAPDQRGYGETGNALNDDGTEQSVPLYDMAHLCGDMDHLCAALEIEQAIFVGHDWGGIMIWQLPFHHPERIAGLIGVNTPFIPRLAQDPIDAFRAVMGDDMYIVAFQDYGKAEAALERDVAKSLRSFYRKAGMLHTDAPHNPDFTNFAILKILESDEAGWPGDVLLSDEDFAIYKNAFEKTGFRGPINWYRNFSRNWRLSKNFEQKVTQPSLMICAENDLVLPPSMAENMPKYVQDLETHIIPDCGHWTQNEQPEALATLMIDWLTRRFG